MSAKKQQKRKNLKNVESEFPSDFFESNDFETPTKKKKRKNKNHKNKQKDFSNSTSGDGINHFVLTDKDQVFALPSELGDDSDAYKDFLAEDGFYKKSQSKALRRGSKIRTGKEDVAINESKISEREYKFIGRKGVKRWSKKVSTLRSKFGFSWQKNARKVLIFSSLTTIFLVITLTSVAAVAIDMWNNTESIEELQRRPSENSVVFARDGKTKLFEFFDEERREVISEQDIPLIMKSATLALEDENFYENQDRESWQRGIPWTNLAGATFKCLVSGGDECRGASGISQQLIKNMTGDDSQDVDRKIRELFRAIKLNQEKTPDEILSAYLNWVPFGRNAYGIQEASRAYFNRPANVRNEQGEHVMNPAEACYLSAIINRPGYYQSAIPSLPAANRRIVAQRQGGNENTENEEENTAPVPQPAIDLENRKNECLIKLRQVQLKVYQRDQEGNIIKNSEGLPILTDGFAIKDDEELEKWIQKPVINTSDKEKAQRFRKEEGGVAFVNTRIDDPFPHFREHFTKEIERVVDRDALNRNGYDIVTTLDPEMQNKVDRIVKDFEPTLKSFGGNNAAAIVLDGPTGEILSMVGSFGYDREEIDGKVNVTTAPRQPGSSVKQYVYMAAFANGFNPGNIIVDAQTSWGGYTPRNFSGTFNGPVTIRRSLQGSLNIPALKALFLVDNSPAWDERSKLNTFFDFAENLGLDFPCIDGGSNAAFPGGVERCSVDEERGITQEMIDNAARSRCGIATALGGCEVTMISHATAFNTILQEGNKRTATPFISITDKNRGEDVYKIRQNSDNQPFPTRDLSMDNEEEKEKILLARQTANLMTDSQSRIPEFGSLRSNLNVRNYGSGISDGYVAAKTGTTNGPKDFWTCGGSVHYTVCIWAGRTDNQAMSRNASAGITAATLWQRIMESIHQDKEGIRFSTEGLIPGYVGGVQGRENEETGEIEGGVPGRTELLTPRQNSERFIKRGIVALESQEDVEEFKKKDIFENRSALLSASYYINSLDGGLFVEGKNLEEYRELVKCRLLVGEFPQLPNWNDPVVKLASSSDSFCTLPEPSQQDQFADSSKPEIQTNFSRNIINNISQINVSANFPSDSPRRVKKIELLVNGEKTSSGDGNNSVSARVIPSAQAYNIIIRVIDNLDKIHTERYENIRIGSQLTGQDISNITCNGEGICSFNILDTSKVFQEIRIGFLSQNYPCEVNNQTVSCDLSALDSLAEITSLTVLIDSKGYVKQINR